MRRSRANGAGLAGIARPALGAAGACALMALVLARPGPCDAPSAGAVQAAPSSAASPGAASQPRPAPDATSQSRPQARSGIVIFRLAHADAARVAQIVQQLLAGEEVTVVSDPRTNSVIVSGRPWVIEKTKRLISALDAPLAFRQAATAASRPATLPARLPATHYADGNCPRAADTAPGRGRSP